MWLLVTILDKFWTFIAIMFFNQARYSFFVCPEIDPEEGTHLFLKHFMLTKYPKCCL